MKPTIKITMRLILTASVAVDYRFVKIDVPNAISTTVNTINARGDIVKLNRSGNG